MQNTKQCLINNNYSLPLVVPGVPVVLEVLTRGPADLDHQSIWAVDRSQSWVGPGAERSSGVVDW